MPQLQRLKRRAEFLRVAADRAWVRPGLVVQAHPRAAGEPGADRLEDPQALRLGLTASRKVGGAVVRNRARRRLRAAAEALLPERGRPGFDYVLVARRETPERPWRLLLEDLEIGLEETAKPTSKRRPRRRAGR